MNVRESKLAALALVFGLTLAPRAATAQSTSAPTADEAPKRADAIFRAAKDALDAEDYLGAAVLFRRAADLRLTGNTRFNEAQCWVLAEAPAEAAEAFERALVAPGLDDVLREPAEMKLDELRGSLTRLEVTATDGAELRIERRLYRSFPAVIYLVPGRHLLRIVEASGRPWKEEVTATAGSRRSLDLVPPPVETSGDEQTPAGAAPLSWLASGGTLLGLGVAGGIAAGVLGSQFRRAQADFEASGFEDADARRTALDLRLATNVAAFTAAGIGAVGAGLLVVGLTASSSDEVAVGVGPGAMTLRVRF